MATVIKYSSHNALSRIHPVIPDQSMTSSKSWKGRCDLVTNERKKLNFCFEFFGGGK